MTKIAIAAAAALVLLSSFTPALAGHCGGDAHAETASKKADIVDTAVAAGSFNTLVAAVKAAGLVDALKGEGPLTVFAPTDEAFAALPKGTVESLLLPENKDRLVEILTYHVVSGEVPSTVAVDLKRGMTLNGQSFAVNFDGKTLTVGGANVVQADIKASNGIIHVIDKVMIPAERTSR